MAVSAVKKGAKPAEDAHDAAPEGKAGKRGSGSKLMLIAGIVLAVGASVGGTYRFLQRGNGAANHEPKVEAPKPPVFVTLDAFTVNLQLEETPQFLQVGLSLKVRDNTVADDLKLHMPEVRDRTLLLLSSQKASTLLTLDGKKKLANVIVATINAILEPASVYAPPAAPAHPPKPAKPAQAEGTAAEGEAEGDDKAAIVVPPPAAPEPPPRRPPVQSVLFTSFIVQ